jgi:hypothetical protein
MGSYISNLQYNFEKRDKKILSRVWEFVSPTETQQMNTWTAIFTNTARCGDELRPLRR